MIQCTFWKGDTKIEDLQKIINVCELCSKPINIINVSLIAPLDFPVYPDNLWDIHDLDCHVPSPKCKSFTNHSAENIFLIVMLILIMLLSIVVQLAMHKQIDPTISSKIAVVGGALLICRATGKRGMVTLLIRSS